MSISIEHEKRTTDIRIIIAFEDEFQAYKDTLAATIRILRPDVEVVITKPENTGEVAKSFAPDIVISSQDADAEGVLAWINLSLDPIRPTKVCVDGEYSEMVNPSLDRLLLIIEEVAQCTRRDDS